MKAILILIAVLTGLISQLNAQEEVDTIWTRQFGDINDVAFTPDESKVIVSADAVVYVFDSQTGEELQRFPNNITNKVFVRISEDGKYLYTSKPAKFDLETYETIIDEPELKLYFDGMIVLESQNKLIGSKGYDPNEESLVVLDTETFEVLDTIRSLDECYKIEKSYDDKYFVVESKYLISDELITELVLYDAETLEEIRTLYKGELGIASMQFNYQNDALVYLNDDLYFINLSNGDLNKTLKIHAANDFFLGNDNKIIVDNINELTTEIIDLEDDNVFKIIDYPCFYVWGLSANNKYLSISSSKILSIFDYTRLVSVKESFGVNIKEISYNSNYFRIALTENHTFEYFITDYQGSILMSGRNTDTDLVLDISDLSVGVYFFSLNQKGRSQVIKFIKE